MELFAKIGRKTGYSVLSDERHQLVIASPTDAGFTHHLQDRLYPQSYTFDNFRHPQQQQLSAKLHLKDNYVASLDQLITE